MMSKFLFLLSIILLSLGLQAQEKNLYDGTEIDLRNFKISKLYKGVNKSFVNDNLDGSEVYSIVSKEKNIWHLEIPFILSGKIKDEQDIWLQYRSSISATHIYINNKLLLTNGIVGNSTETETSGKNLVRKRIPRGYLNNGDNHIELVFSNYNNQDAAALRDVSIGTFEGFQAHSFVMSMAPILFSGIFIFAVLINIALYFSLNKQKVFLALGILFLTNFFLVIHDALYWNGLVPTSSFINSSSLHRGLGFFIYFMLLFVLYYEYNLKRKQLFFSILIFVAVAILSNFTPFSTVLILSLVPFSFSLYFSTLKNKNTYLITASLFLVFLLNLIDEYDLIENFDYGNLFVTSLIFKINNFGVVIFAVVMIFTSAKGILQKTKDLNETEIKLELLEYQFLQKHIQPHFLMNSLMSLQQLISTNTENAKIMIEALSEEFHLLTTMSKQKMVLMSDEIEMCKAHLQIMSIQQKSNYKMITHGFNGNELIPPAVIHTLVENGVTHGYSGSQDAIFELNKVELDDVVIYTLFNDSNFTNQLEKQTTGTGLKYVEARLDACYHNKWKMHSRRVENGWEVIIEIQTK
ncbi:histidine kinase [Lutimonas halocynthiae]|uniref:histidine kinase n=1 Tax=Lutimonas halocynthiae TaxID=1446477 RepID=UPI0025B46D9D|nr:histidine kinase [Lutimonas halocynthiae]MDN3643152.1 histidine kinase [Lutimonas halocynthiae]